MSLQQWADNSWIKAVEPSVVAMSDLLAVAAREIADASIEGISVDGRFAHAYNAVRTLCGAALHAAGFTVPKGQREHERMIDSLQFTLGEEWIANVDYFHQCRRLRHQALYERQGVTQRSDADELLETAIRLQQAVREWLQRNHPDLLARP